MQGQDAEAFALDPNVLFVDQLLELYRAWVLRRLVYDCLAIEKLLASGELNERFDERVLEQLWAAGLGPRVSGAEFAQLQRYGVFREDVEYDAGRVRARGGSWIGADLADGASRARISA